MKPTSPIASNFDGRICSAQSDGALDQLIREIYQAEFAGRLNKVEADELRWIAEDRRQNLKKTARPSRRPPPTQSQGTIRTPDWISGGQMFLHAWQAKKAFYLRREEWREQICRDNNNFFSKLDLRIAMEISFNLNADPMDHRFGQCFCSLKTLTCTLSCRPESFLESADRLESFGHLKIYHGRGRGNPNRYEPVIHARGLVAFQAN
jgi:hypothetical protein